MRAIIVRESTDDFFTFRTANAMQSMDGVEVISIVCRPCEKLTARGSSERWNVFAKYNPDVVTPGEIDKAIAAELNK